MERYINSVVESYLSHNNFNASNIGMNILRIMIVGIVYTTFEIIGLTLSTLGFFESDIRAYVMIVVLFHLAFMPFLAISYRFKWFAKESTYEILTNIYYGVIILWASLFTALVYLDTLDITVYSIVLFLVATVFIIHPNRSSIIYILNFILFAGMIYIKTPDIKVANALVFKSLIVSALALVVSHGNYITRKNLYDSKEELVKANKELKEKANKDSLTHLYNNEFVFDYLTQKTKVAYKQGEQLALIMIDIDNFKLINDTYGHLFGDQVIKEVSETIVRQTRNNDLVGRYGGEEFIVILSDTYKSTAIEIAERIRLSVENMVFDKFAKITVSLGVAELTTSDANFLVNAADVNLYKAKNSGKNRVVA